MIVFAKHTIHLPGYRTVPAGGAFSTDDPAYEGREDNFETAEELYARQSGVTHRPEPPLEEAVNPGGASGRTRRTRRPK